ncbi:MAG TPA: EamA family transporter, partial [bacterium]|nr:EamA family transporter [bacterium]
MKDNRLAKGFLLMMGANVTFCVMSGLIRNASNIDAYKTTLFRFIIGLALLGVAAIAGKIKLRFVNIRFLFLRGIFGGLAVFFFFLSIAKLGVGKGTVLNSLYPI